MIMVNQNMGKKATDDIFKGIAEDVKKGFKN